MHMKVKTKRQLDAQHEADRAVLDMRARKAGDVRAATPDEIDRFAVGGCGGGCGGGCSDSVPMLPQICRPDTINDCYHKVASDYGCPLKVTSGGVYAQPGGGVVRFQVEPIQSNFFLPVAARYVVYDATNPDTLRFLLVTAVSIKNIPQENYHVPNPTALTVAGMDTRSFSSKISGEQTLAVQVAWGPFARVALAEHLEVTGWSQYAVGVSINVRLEIWGYELPNLPGGWNCGYHPAKPDAPSSAPPRA